MVELNLEVIPVKYGRELTPAHPLQEHHYGCNTFFGETICKKYLQHLPPVYGIKCRFVSAYSIRNRKIFLTNCIYEKDLPISISQIFSQYFPGTHKIVLRIFHRESKILRRFDFRKGQIVWNCSRKNFAFYLARNLIRPLGSTHNFTQSGWLILFNPNHLFG